MSLTESTVEDAALSWLGELGFAVKHGPEIAPGELHAEHDGFDEVVLARRQPERSLPTAAFALIRVHSR